MLRLFEILTWFGAGLATLMLLAAFGGGMSAPQQGATAGMSLGLIVIPYCIVGMLQRRESLKRTNH